MLGDSSPFACLRRDDLWESLAKNPATRPYVADSGFQATIKKLQNGADDQAAAQEAMKDPRVMAPMWGSKEGCIHETPRSNLEAAKRPGNQPAAKLPCVTERSERYSSERVPGTFRTVGAARGPDRGKSSARRTPPALRA